MPELIEGGTSWIQTIGGIRFDLVNPRVEHINFLQIARVLPRVARYAGHTEDGVLSVAQHCEQGARAIMRDTDNYEAAKAFLLHDAHEALVGDLATPALDALAAIAQEKYGEWSVVAGDIVRSTLKEQKRRLDVAIYTAAGMRYPLAPDVAKIVREYDVRMCRTERDQRMAPPPQPWHPLIEEAKPIEGLDLYPYQAATVEAFYIAALYDFGILT